MPKHQPPAPQPDLPVFRIPSGRERRARYWSILWKVGILPSLVLILGVTLPYWLPLIQALPEYLR